MADRELEYRHSDYSNDPQKYRKEFQELENKNLKGLNNITPEIIAQIDRQVNSKIRELDKIIDSSRKFSFNKLDSQYPSGYNLADDDAIWKQHEENVKGYVIDNTAKLETTLGVMPSPKTLNVQTQPEQPPLPSH